MEANGLPSRTSILTAAVRAFGAREPDASVRNPDWVAERVADETVAFDAISYSELWRLWAEADTPLWLSRHVAALRERYELRLG